MPLRAHYKLPRLLPLALFRATASSLITSFPGNSYRSLSRRPIGFVSQSRASVPACPRVSCEAAASELALFRTAAFACGDAVGATPCGCPPGTGRHGGLPLQMPLRAHYKRPQLPLALFRMIDSRSYCEPCPPSPRGIWLCFTRPLVSKLALFCMIARRDPAELARHRLSSDLRRHDLRLMSHHPVLSCLVIIQMPLFPVKGKSGRPHSFIRVDRRG